MPGASMARETPRLMAEHRNAPTAGEQPAAGQPRLLIVEDEMMVAWGLVDTVHALGWKVYATARTQDAAIEAASQLKPDAILIDYRLAYGRHMIAAAPRA